MRVKKNYKNHTARSLEWCCFSTEIPVFRFRLQVKIQIYPKLAETTCVYSININLLQTRWPCEHPMIHDDSWTWYTITITITEASSTVMRTMFPETKQHVNTAYCVSWIIIWSKPGSINTPQKQDENRGFGPGQAGGRTPGKLGGNVPFKLAKMRGKKEQQTSRNVASKGTTWHHHKLFIIICFQVGMRPALLQDTRCIPGFHYRS